MSTSARSTDRCSRKSIPDIRRPMRSGDDSGVRFTCGPKSACSRDVNSVSINPYIIESLLVLALVGNRHGAGRSDHDVRDIHSNGLSYRIQNGIGDIIGAA